VSATLDLFSSPASRAAAALAAAPPSLRDYQVAAVEATRRELETNRGTLILLATGLGKTQCAAELIRTWPGRACFIAHRQELITQAARRIRQFTGEDPDIEKADDRASASGTRPVVASIQSLARESRIQRFPKDAFSLIVIDEVHHGTSATYRAVIDYFPDAKLVGLTATPDRLDGEALGQILDSVAYRMELGDAIREGLLAPVRMRVVKVDAIDFSQIRTVAGELHQGDLDAIMAREEALHGVARPTVELTGNRPTIVFTTSIDNAVRLAEIIDRYAGRTAATVVHSKLSDVDRAEAFRLYESGERQFLVNVGVTCEGYDYPPTSCVVLGRPTKSRALVTQMVGRGTRGGPKFPIPGKEDCLVIDFTGANEQHDVMHVVDALAGDVTDEEAKLIKAQVERATAPLSIDEARQLAEEARRRAEEQAAAQRRQRDLIKAKVAYRDFDPNPYVALGVRRDFLHEKYGYAAASDAQKSFIRRALGKHADKVQVIEKLGKLEASRLIAEIQRRRDRNLCTLPQLYALKKQGIDAGKFSFAQASRVMDALSKNNWKPLGQEEIRRVLQEPKGGAA
jgi:superfamily II DNA or RNA helicase